MNLLVDELPQSVEIEGKRYEIRWDFRISVLYELLMDDVSVPLEDKFPMALNLYFPAIPEDMESAMEAIQWFYNGGQEESKRKHNGRKAGKAQRIYSFHYDAPYIYAAFMSQYGIDLNSVTLHWWKFIALFQALDGKNQFSKIMGYRAMEISKDMPQKQKEFYREMKELYRLPVSETEQQEVEMIEKALLGGGDLNGVL